MWKNLKAKFTINPRKKAKDTNKKQNFNSDKSRFIFLHEDSVHTEITPSTPLKKKKTRCLFRATGHYAKNVYSVIPEAQVFKSRPLRVFFPASLIWSAKLEATGWLNIYTLGAIVYYFSPRIRISVRNWILFLFLIAETVNFARYKPRTSCYTCIRLQSCKFKTDVEKRKCVYKKK